MTQALADLFRIPAANLTDIIFLVAGGLVALAWIIQIFYYFFFFLQVHRYRKPARKEETDPVSVIICAKNEADNLRKFLPAVLNQDYPEFQVIVVNDGSQDDTASVLTEFQLQYKNLYVTSIEHTHPYPHAKKLAQTIGIKAARYDQLLFIDADCRPAGPEWILSLQSNFLPRKEIILGYGAYERKKGLANLFIRTDTLWIAQEYFSFAIRGFPFMGVGRNLAYRRSLFFNNKGFANHLHLQSGDDDLFVNQTAEKVNTTIELDPRSFTYSEPMATLSGWFRQKRRHLTTGFYYKALHRFLISLEVVSREFFYLGIIVLLSFWKLPGYLLALLLSRWIVYLWVTKLTMRRLQEKGIWLFSLIYDLAMPILTGYLMIKNRLSRNKKFNW
jgi:glycosyltransferase involved in cell wall biosynthesis